MVQTCSAYFICIIIIDAIALQRHRYQLEMTTIKPPLHTTEISLLDSAVCGLLESIKKVLSQFVPGLSWGVGGWELGCHPIMCPPVRFQTRLSSSPLHTPHLELQSVAPQES